MKFDDLDADVLLRIISCLHPEDISMLRKVSRFTRSLCSSREAWLAVLKAYTLRRYIRPNPYGPLFSLWPAEQLEAFARRCISFSDAVKCSPTSLPTPRVAYRTLSSLHSRIIWMDLVYGRWLFSSSMDGYIRAWDIGGRIPIEPILLAEWWATGFSYTGKIEAVGDSEELQILVDSIHDKPRVHVLSFRITSSQIGRPCGPFLETARHAGPSHVLAGHSGRMLCGSMHGVPAPNVLHYRTDETVILREDDEYPIRPLDACISGSTVMVLKPNDIRIYELPQLANCTDSISATQVIGLPRTSWLGKLVPGQAGLPFAQHLSEEDSIAIILRSADGITRFRLRSSQHDFQEGAGVLHSKYTLDSIPELVHNTPYVGCMLVGASGYRILLSESRTCSAWDAELTHLTRYPADGDLEDERAEMSEKCSDNTAGHDETEFTECDLEDVPVVTTGAYDECLGVAVLGSATYPLALVLRFG